MTAPGAERWAEILRAREEHARPGPNCPEPDRIWSAVTLELPKAEREAVIDHTVECGACAEAWRLALECARDLPRTEAISSPPSRTRHTKAWLGVAAAAVLAIAAGISLWNLRSADPEFRQSSREVPESLLPRDATLPRDAAVFRWSTGPAGARYELTVTTEDLAVVATVRGLERPEYQLPRERLAGVAAGSRLLWRVVAELPDGRRASSATFEVTVR